MEEIKLINDIIKEAIIHGVDSGGSYEQNEEDLTRAVNNWLSYKGLSDKYKLVRCYSDQGFNINQIIPI